MASQAHIANGYNSHRVCSLSMELSFQKALSSKDWIIHMTGSLLASYEPDIQPLGNVGKLSP